MSVNPGFGGQEFLPLCLDKIAHLAELREEMGLNFRIEVDGGIANDTVALVVEAGADMLVAGSAIFAHGEGRAERTRIPQDRPRRRPGRSSRSTIKPNTVEAR